MSEYKIELLIQSDQKTADEINNLLSQLTTDYSPITMENLEKILKSQTTLIFVAKNPQDKIIGMATLVTHYVLHKIQKARIEDVVVDSDYRARGIGIELIKKTIEKARKVKVNVIELNSNSNRIAANNIYKKLGFELYATNCYKISL